MSLRKALLAAAVAGLGLATSANASIINSLVSVTPAGGGNWNWTYSTTLAADEQIVTGSFFTVYDFGPTVVPATTSTTTGFGGVNYLGTFTWTQHLTDTPATGVVGLPRILNVRATYNGSLGAVNGTTLGNGATDILGDFTLTSPSGLMTLANQDSSALKFGGPANGTPNVNFTQTAVPTVPEPASLALLGTALFGIGALRRYRSG